jgi:replication-associated recombination protein RarA
MQTKNGRDPYELISALQKDIRRGNEEQAMHWALEMCPEFEYWLWQRLIVIAHEDIGIANPQVMGLIPQMRDSYLEFRRKGRGSARLVLANAILLLARSPKSRLADHFQCAVNQDLIHGIHLPVPDYALDKHTRKGKAKGRGFKHFVNVGTILENKSLDPDPYAERAAQWWTSKDFIDDKWPKASRKKNPKNQPKDEENESGQASMF